MKLLKGGSIVEVIVASALISVAVIAALSLMNHTQKQNSYAKGLAEATKYGSQSLDWLRTQRDIVGWAIIADKVTSDGSPATYCLSTIPFSTTRFTDVAAGACGTTDFIPSTIFIREITIDSSDAANGTLTITSKVRWQEKIMRETSVETELSRWN